MGRRGDARSFRVKVGAALRHPEESAGMGEMGRRWTGSSELRGTEGLDGGRLWRWCLCALVQWNEEGLKEQRGASRGCSPCCSVEGLAGEWRRGAVLRRGDRTRATANGARCGLRGLEEKAEARAPNA